MVLVLFLYQPVAGLSKASDWPSKTSSCYAFSWVSEIIVHISLGGDHLSELTTHVDHDDLILVGADDVGKHRVTVDVVGMDCLGWTESILEITLAFSGVGSCLSK